METVGSGGEGPTAATSSCNAGTEVLTLDMAGIAKATKCGALAREATTAGCVSA